MINTYRKEEIEAKLISTLILARVAAKLMEVGGVLILNPMIHAPQACAKSTSDCDRGPTPTCTTFTKTWKELQSCQEQREMIVSIKRIIEIN